MTDVAVVGAGPYGLAVSAWLAARGLDVRTFGRTMATWTEHMPAGMFLKSEGFASDISHPRGGLTLERFCREHGHPYAPLGVPAPVDVFAAYGRWFAERAVPGVEDATVTAVRPQGGGYAVELAGGDAAEAAAVVVATGFAHFAYVPAELHGLPPALATHTAAHASLEPFAGADVAVVGAGQSALETAALLHEAGARPVVVVRGRALAWNGRPELDRRLPARLRWPLSPLGTGLRLWGYAHLAGSFRRLPERPRVRAAWETLGPAGAWWLRERVDGRIPVVLGHRLAGAEASGRGVRLRLEGPEGPRELEVDHVIAGTGYRPDLARLGFLDAGLLRRLALVSGCPRLDAGFESSVRGLFFVGFPAAPSFGPVMRFVCGTGVAGRRLAARVPGRVRGRRRRFRP